MRTLSDQLSSIRIDEADWGVIELGAPGGAAFAGRRSAYVHLVMNGSVFLSLHGRDAPIELTAGSSAFVFGRDHHSLSTDPSVSPTSVRYFDEPRGSDRVATIRVGSSGNAPVQTCLSGAFEFDRLAALRLMELMPEMAQGRSFVLVASDITPNLPQFVAQHDSGAGFSAYLTRLADLLLVLTIRRHADRPMHKVTAAGNTRLDPQLVKAVRLMTINPAMPWTVAELAQKVMMSRSAFSVKFTASVGETPMAYLTRIRMNRAADLVARTDQPLSSVAQSLGYKSFSSFSHLFKRWYGEAPGRFRKNPQASVNSALALQTSHWQVFS